MSTSSGELLAWVPATSTTLFERAPEGIEIAPIPADPGSDPRLADVNFLVVSSRENLTQCYPQMTSLEVLQTASSGVELQAPFTPAGVVLCSARGVADTAVAEWVLAAILAGEKSFPAFGAEQLTQQWSRRPLRVLADETVCIVGSGSIGRAVVERLAPFGCTVVEVARRPRSGVLTIDALPSVLPEVDVVVVLLPITDATAGLVDHTFFRAMRPGSLFVNASRGAVVVTDDLVAALQDGHIRAVLDVTDPEPLPAGHPLWTSPGVFITPHVAGLRPRTENRSDQFIVEQLGRYVRGEPLHNVVSDGY